QRELVGFARRAQDVADAKWRRQRRDQTLGVLRQPIAQVARVRVQDRHLLGGGLHDTWVGVANVWDVVVRVQILATDIVVQVLLSTTYDLERIGVSDAEVAADQLSTGGQRLGLRFLVRRRSQAGQDARIRG